MNRREVIALLGGAAVAWPVSGRAQQPDRVRRIGVLMFTTSDEPESQARITALGQGLQEAGWSVGRNVRIDVRWSGGDFERVRRDAQELVSLGPDVLVAGIGPTTQAFQQISRTLPIVFAQSVDPVGLGIVKSMARPGGNATGFTQFEYTLSAKWLELLREVAPQIARVGFVRDAGAAVSLGQWAVIGAAAAPLGVEVSPVDLAITTNTEDAVDEFARGPNGGLIVGVGTNATIQRAMIVALAARHKLPAVYPYRFFVDAGGLMSYGPSLIDLYRRTAGYVDRILKGEKPADLPVQAPTKYELILNGGRRKGIVYYIGNVLSAVAMTRQNFGAGLYAPYATRCNSCKNSATAHFGKEGANNYMRSHWRRPPCCCIPCNACNIISSPLRATRLAYDAFASAARAP